MNLLSKQDTLCFLGYCPPDSTTTYTIAHDYEHRSCERCDRTFDHRNLI